MAGRQGRRGVSATSTSAARRRRVLHKHTTHPARKRTARARTARARTAGVRNASMGSASAHNASMHSKRLWTSRRDHFGLWHHAFSEKKRRPFLAANAKIISRKRNDDFSEFSKFAPGQKNTGPKSRGSRAGTVWSRIPSSRHGLCGPQPMPG